MDWNIFLVVLGGTALVCIVAALILTSLYANEDIPTTARGLWRAYFAKFDLPPADLDPTKVEEPPQEAGKESPDS